MSTMSLKDLVDVEIAKKKAEKEMIAKLTREKQIASHKRCEELLGIVKQVLPETQYAEIRERCYTDEPWWAVSIEYHKYGYQRHSGTFISPLEDGRYEVYHDRSRYEKTAQNMSLTELAQYIAGRISEYGHV